ncbi:MAG TPA: MarR family transcriptional regulator [Bacillota bacterium]|nr:MarR family transcriptional regulator [Bacillota bacterium]
MIERGYEETADKIVAEFAKTIEMFDLTTSEAHLFAHLYIKNKPLTLDEMGEAMGKSKAAMSTSVRSLLDMNLVTRVWKKGVRKDLYKANNPLFKTFMQTYLNKWIDATGSQKEALEKIRKCILAEQTKEQKEAFQNIERRLEEMITFHEQIMKTFQRIL